MMMQRLRSGLVFVCVHTCVINSQEVTTYRLSVEYILDSSYSQFFQYAPNDIFTL